MESFEKLAKSALLFAFCLLNVIDMIQTTAFLKMGIEGNMFAVHNPLLWSVLKASFAFGLPVGLSLLDNYLENKNGEGLCVLLKQAASALYIIIFLADIFFLFQVSRNTALLGGRIIP